MSEHIQDDFNNSLIEYTFKLIVYTRCGMAARKLAVFFDGENVKNYTHYIMNHIKTIGAVKTASVYGDFSDQRMAYWKQPCLLFNIEPIMVFTSNGKNSADIRMCLDAIQLAVSDASITDVVIITGDMDFVSLVRDLKKHGKHVIGMSPEPSTSTALKASCDEFVTLIHTMTDKNLQGPSAAVTPTASLDIGTITLTIDDLFRKVGKDLIQIGRLKEHILQIDNTFTEGRYGMSSFSKFLVSLGYRIVHNREHSCDYFCVSPYNSNTMPTGFIDVFECQLGSRASPLTVSESPLVGNCPCNLRSNAG